MTLFEALRTDMVNGIYSEPYILIFWTGVTLIRQSGPSAEKMVLTTQEHHWPVHSTATMIYYSIQTGRSLRSKGGRQLRFTILTKAPSKGLCENLTKNTTFQRSRTRTDRIAIWLLRACLSRWCGWFLFLDLRKNIYKEKSYVQSKMHPSPRYQMCYKIISRNAKEL